jgi:hypothetical protein
LSGYIRDPKRRYRKANLFGCGVGCITLFLLCPVIFGVLWSGAHSDHPLPQSRATITWLEVFGLTALAFFVARAAVLITGRNEDED